VHMYRRWRWRQALRQARRERRDWLDLLVEWCVLTVGRTQISFAPCGPGYWIVWDVTPRMGYPRVVSRWDGFEAARRSALRRWHTRQRRTAHAASA
jgi:hypothetical protein